MCDDGENKGNNDTIQIPRKLLKQIYIDYQIFSEDYIINCDKEIIGEEYWVCNPDSIRDVMEKIDFYLKKE